MVAHSKSSSDCLFRSGSKGSLGSSGNTSSGSAGSGLPAGVSGHCPLVARLPPIVRSGNEFEDLARVTERDAFAWILDVLWEHRRAILPTQAFLKRMMDQPTAADDNKFEGKLTTLGKLDPHWMAKWIVQVSRGRVTMSRLDAAMCIQPEIVQNLFCLLLGLPPNTSLCPELYVIAIMVLFLKGRADRLPLRMPVVEKMLSAAGVYDCIGGAVYTMEFEGDRVTRVSHIDGLSKEVPAHRSLTREFRMHNWFDDQNCFMMIPGDASSKLYLRELFSPGEGPNALVLSKKALTKTVQELVQTGATPTAAELVSVPDDSEKKNMFPRAAAKRKQASAAQAKQVLHDYRAKRAKQGEVTFAAVAVPAPSPNNEGQGENAGADE